MNETKESKERQGRAIAAWRPFTDADRWPSLWEGFFPGLGGRPLTDLFRDVPSATRGGPLLPPVDLCESDTQYTITTELPGVQKDDVALELHDDVLVVRGEKKSEREEKKDRGRHLERSYGSFSRAFTLPADADADRLDASFAHGVLTIRIPRKEATKPKQIAIKS